MPKEETSDIVLQEAEQKEAEKKEEKKTSESSDDESGSDNEKSKSKNSGPSIIARLKEFSRKKYPAERTIHVGKGALQLNSHFPNNFIKTSKYSVLSFVPKYLIEQFMRLANFYFLIISALQLIPGLSPTGRFTTLVGLVIVLALNAVKEILEDAKRHRQDNEVNSREAEVFNFESGAWDKVKWYDIFPGMVVRLHSGHAIPADVIIINSSEPLGICYIETSSLDGETNLKIRQSHPDTTSYGPTNIAQLKAVIQCENRNPQLYDFVGNFTIEGQEKAKPLSAAQLLLRGASIQNTEWVLGIVINSGYDTKLILNSISSRIKKSNVERKTNSQLTLIWILLAVMCLVCTIGNVIWERKIWYLGSEELSSGQKATRFFTQLGTFLVLFNNLIPISLYVSMEFVKFGQAYFINNDIEMYDKRTDTPAQARNSSLNEELGQVQYIFSDKTGTLTRNQMQFKNCSIAGVMYGDKPIAIDPETIEVVTKDQEPELADPFVNFSDPTLLQNLESHSTKKDIHEFLSLLAVCHTVIPQYDESGKFETYQAASPDEAALVRAARQLGYVFSKRTPDLISVQLKDSEQTYTVLNVIEFNSTRKRMSIIVRTPDHKIVLYCKGADTMIYERLIPNCPYRDETQQHLNVFAAIGLRTLCLAYKVLDEDNYTAWAERYEEASVAIQNREEKVTAVAEEIEKDLVLIGATAIEDRLQQGVPEAIQSLAQAGIKIWMLTGDKLETARNIGFSCNLLTSVMKIMTIEANSKKELKKILDSNLELYKQAVEADDKLGLIIEGGTLRYALEGKTKLKFLSLATKCKAVICCRVSPLQKALVVALVKDNLNAITLSIGDGGNDVSMITTAHVGVGISGEEGLQAARAADYAIAQFRFLVPLLLIHGRYAYRGVSRLIQYSFYKNIVLVFTQFWFTLINGWSGQTLYEQWTLSLFNVLFSLTPIITMGVFDRDFDRSTVMNNPQLYLSGQRNELFRSRVMAGWIASGVIHSTIIFWLSMVAYSDDIEANGKPIGMWGWGLCAFSLVITVLTLKLALETRRWVWPHHLSLWGTFFVFYAFCLIYATWWKVPLDMGANVYFTYYANFVSPKYWYTLIIVTIIALFRDFVWKFYQRTFHPRPIHIIQDQERAEKRIRLRKPKRQSSKLSIQRDEHHGYAFEAGLQNQQVKELTKKK